MRNIDPNDLKFEDFSVEIKGDAPNHFYMGRKWRLHGTKNNDLAFPLLYSSLEFRLCIERLVFEIYIMLATSNMITNAFNEDELRRIDNSFISMTHVITENSGNRKNFRNYFIFCKHHAIRLTNFRVNPSIPDLNTLESKWRDLSKYLHYTQNPENTWANPDWIKRGYEILYEVESYIYNLMFKNAVVTVQVDTMPEELKELLYKFLNEQIDENQLMRMMDIMKPVLAKRGIEVDNLRLTF